jgi:RNA polymerase sigma-70 factor (ECF subfamily)
VLVYKSLAGFDPSKGAFTTWLHRITINQCLNHRRKRNLTATHLDETVLKDQQGLKSEFPDAYLANQEAVWQAVHALSDRQQVVVILRFYWKLSYADVAQILEIPLGTVKSRLDLAIKTLRQALEKQERCPCRMPDVEVTMNCEMVQSFLVSYLDNETTPSERVLIQAHLSGCAACSEKLSRIADVEGQISSALQHRAVQAAPSPQAWERLEASLAYIAPQAQDAHPAPVHSGKWFSRLTSRVSQLPTQLFSGDNKMKKRYSLAAGAVLLTIAVIAISTFTHVTQVSASTILDRAYQAQTRALPTQGILHIRYEYFDGNQGLPQDQMAGTVVDTYYDLGSCNSRSVTTNSKTGVVLDVHTFDGTSVIGGFNYDINASGPLTVYRSPKDPANVDCYKPVEGNDQAVFDQVRSDPTVALVGQETWADGQTVYVLRSQTPAKMVEGKQTVLTPAQTTMYFDTQTFTNLGGKQTITDAGKQVLFWEKLTSVYQILPVGSPIYWDVSDLKGITIIEDPDGIHRDNGARG